jgi:hypothetical protein
MLAMVNCPRMELAMRRLLKKFLPIVLFALAMQIFAPIGACWAAGIAASDPLAQAVICHGNASPGSTENGQTGPHRAHDGCCSVCSVLHGGAPVDMPTTARVVTLDRHAATVVWHAFAPRVAIFQRGSPAQARAPPSVA